MRERVLVLNVPNPAAHITIMAVLASLVYDDGTQIKPTEFRPQGNRQ
jgi:hypothetical protein